MEANLNAIIERIFAIIGHYNLNVNSFSKKIGVSQSTINTMVKRGGGMTMTLCLKILDTFPDVSAEWFIRGEGEMLKNNNEQDKADAGSRISDKFASRLKMMIKGCCSKEEFDLIAEEIDREGRANNNLV